MTRSEFRPPLFFVTALAWLLLSSLLGIGLLLGMTLGTPLPSSIRLIHVHGALLGGVAQMILGAMVAFIPPLLMTGRDKAESHPILYASINLGTIGILLGFGLQHRTVVGIAGFLIVFAFLSILGDALKQVRSSLISPPLNLWFYGVALLVLLVGLGVGEAMALRLIDPTGIGRARLAHIHLNLLGFVTLVIVGTMHNLFPTVLNAQVYSARIARLTFFLMPAGIAILIAGFLLTSLWTQIAAGGLLLIGSLLFAYNIARTWMAAGKPSDVAANHLLVGTMFLVLSIAAGTLVSVNYLWDPPKVPFGTLHLVAYTHLALIGFMLQTIFGALSHLLPISLAVRRVDSPKERGLYLSRLTAISERWGNAQVMTLSLGTLAIVVLAALVWQYPLGSFAVKLVTWVGIGLLVASLAIFSVKVGALLSARPHE